MVSADIAHPGEDALGSVFYDDDYDYDYDYDDDDDDDDDDDVMMM